MQSIDFLPAEYREQRRQRQKSYWRLAVMSVFCAMIVAGIFGQSQLMNRLRAEHARLSTQAEMINQQLQDAGELRERLHQLNARANLAAHLRLDVPVTRILAAVNASTPRLVTLTEFRLSQESADGGVVKRSLRLRPSPSPKEKDSRLPEEIDLEKLRQDSRARRLFLSLSGYAPDDVAISAMLASLDAAGIFDHIQLQYTDQNLLRGQSMRRFGLRLRVRSPFDEATATAASEFIQHRR